MFRNEDRVNIYLDSLMPDFSAELMDLEERALAENEPIIRKQSQSLLRFALKQVRPERVLEIGTAVGFSAIFMAKCLKGDVKITTIEKVPYRIKKAGENFKAFGYDKNIELIEGDAKDVLLRLSKEGRSYDLIFMDAAKGQYLKFLEPALAMLSREGMLITDNVLLEGSTLSSKYAVTRRDRTIHERMREYLYTLTHYEGLETLIVPVGDGMALSIWDADNKRRSFGKIEKGQRNAKKD